MITKILPSEDVPQGLLVVGSYEIEVTGYVYEYRMVIMCWRMDAEISWSSWKAFTTMKDVLKAKQNKTLNENLIYRTVIYVMLYVSETWATRGIWKSSWWEVRCESTFKARYSESRAEGRVWSRSAESRRSVGPDTSQSSETTGGCVQLSNNIQETGNDHSEDLYDDGKMKLSGDSGHQEEGWKHEQNRSSQWPAMGNIYIYIYIYIYIGDY